jgi:hypothetical protein
MTRWHSNPLRSARQTVPRACLLLGVAMSLVLAARSASAQSKAPTDYEVKAAFLANFPKYVEWPPEMSADTNRPLIVAFLSESSVSEALRRLLQSPLPKGRAIVAKVIATEAESAGCHILFVGDVEWRRFPAVLKTLKGANVLTVGESDDFLQQGGIINLVLRDRKVRIQVNLDAARRANLKISSKLLGVADVVKGK